MSDDDRNVRLTLSVVSFSYPRGLTEDDDDDYWGGFVFDCRALPDPHFDPDERLRGCSGCDRPIMEFFERHKEQVDRFLDMTEALVRQSIDVFLENGRDYLQVAFGCHGGHHRSVYIAECFAERLAGLRGVKVKVTHSAKRFWGT